MAYATVPDLEARWRTLTEGEQAMASVLLDDAATYLDSLVCVLSGDSHQMDVLKMVSCAMVKRAMVASESNGLGIDQATATMGPFTQTAHFANPGGDFYLTAAERAQLGIGGGFLASVPPRIGGWYGSNA